MKQYFRIISICCSLIVMELHAQEWVKIIPTFDPSGKYSTYHGVFVDENNGWWLTEQPDASVLHTINGGISWQKQMDSIALYYIKFKDTLHGWMVGGSRILITKDKGKNWDRYFTPSIITCATFFDSLNGFAGGGDSIYATTDGGITWKSQTIEPHAGSIGILDIIFVDKKYGWAVGYDKNINTVDSGKTWRINDSSMVSYSVCFTDTLHGYIVGVDPLIGFGPEGVIKVTSDGGNSWLPHYFSGTELNNVVFMNDSSGWVVGEYGFVLHTTDRGINWTQIESGTTSQLYSVFFLSGGKIGYIFGADSTLLKYDKTVDVKEVKMPSPLSSSLSQNYPNPFNPYTNISYQLSKAGFVNLKVYDMLGRQVATLVDGQKDAGYHSAIFDGTRLSSGIYIVRFTAQSSDGSLLFIKTMKMLLTK